jgi:hypothetical protein
LDLYHELSNSKIENINVTEIPPQTESAILSFTLQKEKVKLDLFSTLTSFNTPASVTLQEIRVESIFPANETTRDFFYSTII